MAYIYKLVDAVGLALAKEGKILLSRPIFSFPGSEGRFIGFANRIHERYSKQKENVKPSEKDNEEIAEWVESFHKTAPYDGPQDVNSDSQIIFCRIMSALCAYFTNQNLFDESALQVYLKKMKTSLGDKVAVIKTKDSEYNHKHWSTNNDDFCFEIDNDDELNSSKYQGFLHAHGVEYTPKYNDYHYILGKYNGDSRRDAKYHNFDRQICVAG